MRQFLLVIFVAARSAVSAVADDSTAAKATALDGPSPGSQAIVTHEIASLLQAGTTRIRVLRPEHEEPGRPCVAIYVLPVEAGDSRRYGDGLAEIKKHDLHNVHRAIFVAPTFSDLPWYADHPSDPATRQESYFLKVVVPLVDKSYPVVAGPKGRLLLGFSKSGWGAWSLLLRHPDVFGRAAAWDAPLMMDRVGRYGSAAIFATQENFKQYQVSRLLGEKAAVLAGDKRLILTGFDGFHSDHQKAHALLDELGIPHQYRDGPRRAHTWHSGWVCEAVELLLAGPDRRSPRATSIVP